MDNGFIAMKHLLLLLFACLILAACEAQATPIGSIATPTSEPESAPVATTVPQLSYGLYTNVVGFVQDVDSISDLASVEIMGTESSFGDFDIVVAYGEYDGWQQSPVKHHISLIINSNLAPLNNEATSSIVRQAFDAEAMLNTLNIPGALPGNAQAVSANETKIALANASYPDGFRLTMAVENVPALEAIAAQFTQRNIDLHIIESETDSLSNNRAHLLLTLWTLDSQRTAWVEQVGEANVLDLLTLPISYLAPDGLNISFTENGWPIPAR
jgi:hypothetical protein